jgi:LmbE family N-acetylglucosaminyl deacetylase
MTAAPAVVVAAHPDDEVLGASGVLTTHRCTVVLATDGVPPDAGDPALAETRVAESRAAHTRLDARVDTITRLGFGDQALAESVDQLATALVGIIRERSDADVYVPAYQRGHPDHDAVYVAAQLARERLAPHEERRGRRWFAYTLYGLDHEGRSRFDWLDPTTFPGAREEFGAPGELDRKAAALRRFASQRPDDSVLAGWLLHPVPELHAPLPALTTRLPALRCFYEEVFRFTQFGIDPERVTEVLEGALARSRPV